MSVQDEITTRRAKSIVLNHWIYSYLPFGAIFSGIRLSSFTPIALWGVSWLIIGATHSSIYTCRDSELCLSIRKMNRGVHNGFEQIRESEARLNEIYDKTSKPYQRQEYIEPFDEDAFKKDILAFLMYINVPGLIGGYSSSLIIKTARKQQKTDLVA